MFSAKLIMGLVCNTAARYLYTTLAGIDYMLGEIISQREYNVVQWRRSVIGADGLGSASLHQVQKERNSRLDELCLLLRPVKDEFHASSELGVIGVSVGEAGGWSGGATSPRFEASKSDPHLYPALQA